MKTYTADFKSINDIDYNITIQTQKGSGTQELTLGDVPFITEMNQDEDMLYSPLRTCGATVTVVTDQFLFDIYSGSATGSKITLTNKTTNNIEFVGFVQPCAFDQNFDNELEEVELEVIDGVSTLQYMPYRLTDKKNMSTFLDIIFRCLKQVDCYKYLYISDNVQINSASGTESICEQLRVSDSNFFDEKDDINTPDDDVAWNCLDVLAEICRFLGYTLVPDGNNIMLIDYDAIKRGYNTYWRYDISGSTYTGKTRVTLSQNKYISSVDDYSDSGNAISLSEVYNKVSVKDEFYTFDSYLPSFADGKTDVNITPSSDSAFSSLPSTDNGHYKMTDTIQQTKTVNLKIIRLQL